MATHRRRFHPLRRRIHRVKFWPDRTLVLDTIDLLHDPLGPLNSRGNERLCSWAWLGIKEIFCRLQMTRHQDSSHNREHSFATLVHERSVSYSLFVRLT